MLAVSRHKNECLPDLLFFCDILGWVRSLIGGRSAFGCLVAMLCPTASAATGLDMGL